MRVTLSLAAAGLMLAACRARPSPDPPQPGRPGAQQAHVRPVSCAEGRPMTAHFYDVGQGLAVLVELPDGRHVMVDTGDEPHRSGCGVECETASAHLLSSLRTDLHGAPVDLLWITHPHSDHVGGAPGVLRAVPVHAYVDDGRDGSRPDVRRARQAAEERGATVSVVEPGHTAIPGDVPRASSPDLRLTAIVPSSWPPACAHDANECSIGLRIDYCASSLLLLGDAEHEEEAALDVGGPATLLQVGHHGSETSTTPGLLARVKPRYAVLSAGKPDTGLNRDYCHPRATIVRRLSRVLGGATRATLRAFDGDRCDRAIPADWVDVPTSDRLWATERDGDVTLVTTGDGAFVRQTP